MLRGNYGLVEFGTNPYEEEKEQIIKYRREQEEVMRSIAINRTAFNST